MKKLHNKAQSIGVLAAVKFDPQIFIKFFTTLKFKMIFNLILLIFAVLTLINCNEIISANLETQPALKNYSMELIPFETLDRPENPNEIRCYGLYGCFSIDFPWKSEHRAFAVL